MASWLPFTGVHPMPTALPIDSPMSGHSHQPPIGEEASPERASRCPSGWGFLNSLPDSVTPGTPGAPGWQRRTDTEQTSVRAPSVHRSAAMSPLPTDPGRSPSPGRQGHRLFCPTQARLHRAPQGMMAALPGAQLDSGTQKTSGGQGMGYDGIQGRPGVSVRRLPVGPGSLGQTGV